MTSRFHCAVYKVEEQLCFVWICERHYSYPSAGWRHEFDLLNVAVSLSLSLSLSLSPSAPRRRGTSSASRPWWATPSASPATSWECPVQVSHWNLPAHGPGKFRGAFLVTAHDSNSNNFWRWAAILMSWAVERLQMYIAHAATANFTFRPLCTNIWTLSVHAPFFCTVLKSMTSSLCLLSHGLYEAALC